MPTPITVLHTADWQIGKPYGRVVDADKRSRLRQVRLEAIARIGAIARDCAADVVVVAGDLFDSPTPSSADVSAVCAAIAQWDRPAVVIPGNHDHGGAGSIWESDLFADEQRRRAPQLQVLLQRQAVELDGLLILPCGLQQRQDSSDPCSWLDQLDWNALPAHKPRLVLAHGGVNGFGGSDLDEENPAAAPNLIDLTARWCDEVDYVALGDWHGCKAVNGKAWYSGTPEPDRFPRSDTYCSGQVLEVQLQRQRMPRVQQHNCGAIGWHPLRFELSSDSDLPLLELRVEQLLGGRVGRDLLLLDLSGQLSIGGAQQLDGLLQRWDAQVLRLKRRGRVGLQADAAELAALGQLEGAPLVAAVATTLQHHLGQDPDDQEVAQALLELHRCVSEASACA